MKIYTFDYSKAAEADKYLCNAQWFLKQDRFGLAENAVAKARELLTEFLGSDNMVEDPDVYGWVKLSDYLELVELINKDYHQDLLNKLNKDGEPGPKS